MDTDLCDSQLGKEAKRMGQNLQVVFDVYFNSVSSVEWLYLDFHIVNTECVLSLIDR